MILNSPTISGSLTVTGNIIASGSITLSGSVASASYADTASFVALAQSASYVLTAQTASFVANAQTASFVALAQSASNAVSAQTASFANAFTVASTLTAQTLVVQTITSSVDFVTGSTRFGSILGNTHVFSGSVTMNPGGLFVSSSGLVGIGNIIPAYTLDVSGTGRFTGVVYLTPSSGSAYAQMVRTATSSGAGLSLFTNSTQNWLIGTAWGETSTNFLIYNYATSTASLKIDYTTNAATLSGFVGINGSPATVFPLEAYINSSTAYTTSSRGNVMRVYNSNASSNVFAGIELGGAGPSNDGLAGLNAVVTSAGSAALTFYTRDSNTFSEKMRINSGGQVGIGVTPSAWGVVTGLQVLNANVSSVGGNTNNSNFGSNFYFDGTNFRYIGTSFATNLKQLNGGFEFYTAPSGTAGNAITFTTAMTITSGGSVGIGANGSAGKLDVNSSTNSYPVLYGYNSSSVPYGVRIIYNTTPNNTDNWFIYADDSTSPRFSVRSNGGIYNFQGNNTNLSDERMKKDIIPLESYWDKFKTLEIVKFKYKDQTHDDFNIGVIAQQVEEVAPEFVDVDGWGKIPEDGIPLKSIYTADLYHTAIKVLQEAMAKIETLEAQNDALQSRIETLESK